MFSKARFCLCVGCCWGQPAAATHIYLSLAECLLRFNTSLLKYLEWHLRGILGPSWPDKGNIDSERLGHFYIEKAFRNQVMLFLIFSLYFLRFLHVPYIFSLLKHGCKYLKMELELQSTESAYLVACNLLYGCMELSFPYRTESYIELLHSVLISLRFLTF